MPALWAGGYLPIDALKRPGVVKALVKHLVNHLHGLLVRLAVGVGADRQYRAAPHTLLVALGEVKDLVPGNLVHHAALARETRCPDLGACVVAQVGPVDVELAVVVCVHELVGQCVLKVPLAVDAVLAQQDAQVRVESAGLVLVAHVAHNVGRVHVTAHLGDLLSHEDDGWRVVQHPVLVLVALDAVRGGLLFGELRLVGGALARAHAKVRSI